MWLPDELDCRYVNNEQFESTWPQEKEAEDYATNGPDCFPNCEWDKKSVSPLTGSKMTNMPWIMKRRRLMWNHFVHRYVLKHLAKKIGGTYFMHKGAWGWSKTILDNTNSLEQI